MRKTIGSSAQVFGLFVALATAVTASATTPGAVCREQTVFKSRSGIRALLGDDTNLYTGLTNGKVQRVSKSDFTATDLATAGAMVTSMTLDASSIYFATTATENNVLHHQIFSVSKQGSTPQLVADITDAIGSMTNDSSFVYWLVPSSSPTTADGKIERVAKSGGSVHVVTSNLAIPTALFVDGTNVYYTEEGINQLPPYGLSKVPAAGGNVVHLASSKPGEGIAGVSGGTIYFEAREDSRDVGLYSIPAIGGSPTALQTPLLIPSQMQQIADGRIFSSVGFFDWTIGNRGGLTVFEGGNAISLSTEQISAFSVDQTAVFAVAGLGNGVRVDRFCLNYATAPRISGISGSASTLGGTALTITGTNFQAGAQVEFAGVAGTVESITPTAIQVVTPAHAAGTFDFYVTNPDGESGRGQISFDSRIMLQQRKRAIEHH